MSRLSRIASIAARIEADQRERERKSAMIHRYEVGQLLRESVPVDDLIELSREIHAGDTEAATRLLEHVATISARWADGARPGGDHAARELIDRERNANRRRLGDIRQ